MRPAELNSAVPALPSYLRARSLAAPICYSIISDFSRLASNGLADISAHVEWTTLAEVAQSSGATPIGFTDQHHFLTGIISKSFPEADFDACEKRALQTLLHPEMLGRNFQALALGKDFREMLSGFHFARDPAAALGL